MNTPTYAAIPDSTTVTRIAKANPKRKELIIVNNSTATLYIGIGRLPSSTNFSIVLAPQGVYITASTQDIMGVWSSAPGGQANVTESNYETLALATQATQASSSISTIGTGTQQVSLATLIAGEDLTNGVLKTEERFTYTNISADTAVKSGAGFLHTLTFAQIDAAPTAGTIIVYDNTAESGTVIFSSTWTTAIFYPTTVTIDASFTTGLYVGFTTTADIGVTVSYR